MDFYYRVVTEIDRSARVDITSFDISKAFDRLDHYILLTKVDSFGFRKGVLPLIKAFLNKRSQRVAIGDARSSLLAVTSGVPQGSVVGPVLFAIYINDILNIKFNGFCSLFADDIKLLSTRGLPMQCDIDRVHCWMNINKMLLNSDKCSVVEIRVNKLSNCFNDSFDYKLGAENIQKCQLFRDLGVQIDGALKFAYHVQNIRSRCHRLIGLCFKCFVLRESHPYLQFWKVYVLPIILYCSPLFGLCNISNVNNLEKVQKYFTRRLFFRLYPNLPVPNYRLRLLQFNLLSIEVLMLKVDLVTLYKIINGSYSLSNISVVFSNHCPTRILVPRVNTTLRRDFYFSRTIRLWNGVVKNRVFVSLSDFMSYISTLSFDSFVKGCAFKA